MVKGKVRKQVSSRRIPRKLNHATVEDMHIKYAKFVEPHLSLIDSIVRRFEGIHHDSQAARQDIIHALIKSNISASGNPKYFIAHTATHTCFNLGRKRRRWFSFESVNKKPELIVDEHMNPLEAAIAREEAERSHVALTAALGKLSERDQTLFLLAAFDYPHAEIAEILGGSPASIRIRYFRLKRVLKNMLEDKAQKAPLRRRNRGTTKKS